MKSFKKIVVTVILMNTFFVHSLYAQNLSVKEILDKVDDLWRGKSSAALMEMNVKTAQWERSLTLKVFSKGKDYSLIRIVLPKKERGTSTLKVEKNIWTYLPKTRRTIKIPSSMMMGSWMGSHFTNDDLVKESRLSEDYFYEKTFDGIRDGKNIYEITLTPRPDAPVVWGKIVLVVLQEGLVPLNEKYFDESGKLMREMVLSDVKNISGRKIPHRFKMIPIDKPEEYTEIIYKKIKFDIPIEDEVFSIQNLERSY